MSGGGGGCYTTVAGPVGFVAGALTWVLLIEWWGLLFGVLLGWIPALIVGIIAMVLWPLAVVVGVGIALVVTRDEPSPPEEAVPVVAEAEPARELMPATGQPVEAQAAIPTPDLTERVEPLDLSGGWTGRYSCLQGLTGARVQVTRGVPGAVEARFDFFPLAENPGVPEGSCEMAGTLSPTGALRLEGVRWRNRPENFIMVTLAGAVGRGDSTLDLVIPECGNAALHLSRSRLDR